MSAELLRLRTVRSLRYVVLGMLVLVALNAAPIMNGAPSTPAEVADSVRGLPMPAVLMPAAYAANGEQRRWRVHASRSPVTTSSTRCATGWPRHGAAAAP